MSASHRKEVPAVVSRVCLDMNMIQTDYVSQTIHAYFTYFHESTIDDVMKMVSAIPSHPQKYWRGRPTMDYRGSCNKGGG